MTMRNPLKWLDTMEADLQSFVAFYLTGKKQPARLDDIGGLKLRPALFSGYHDLTRMRYDFPLVLIEEPVGERFAEPLSGLIDTILGKVAQAPTGSVFANTSCASNRKSARWLPAVHTACSLGTVGQGSESADQAGQAGCRQPVPCPCQSHRRR